MAGRAGPQRPKSKGRGRRARHVPPKGGRNDPNFSLVVRLFSSSLPVQLSKYFRFALIFTSMVLVHFINFRIIMNSWKSLLVGSFHSYNTSRHHFEISGHAPTRRCLHPGLHFRVLWRLTCDSQPHTFAAAMTRYVMPAVSPHPRLTSTDLVVARK